MPKLNANNLDLIPRIPLTLELIREHYHRPMTDDEARERLETVQHECAHLVAGIACGGVLPELQIHAPKESGRRPAGRTNIAVCNDAQEAFWSFAGYVWERHYVGSTKRAEDDLEAGRYYAQRGGIQHEPLLAAAEQFVTVDGVQAIRDATVGVVCLIPQSGVLSNTNLKHLTAWLKKRTRRPVGVPVR